MGVRFFLLVGGGEAVILLGGCVVSLIVLGITSEGVSAIYY